MSCPFKHFCGAVCSNASVTHPGDGTAHIHANGSYAPNPNLTVTAQNYTQNKATDSGWA